MENGIIVLLGSIALVMLTFNIVMHFGKKYYNEDMKRKDSLSQC